MFEHLDALTWSFRAGRERAYAISVYAEPTPTARGVVYTPRIAAESGMEGVACVDDVARASLLATYAFEHDGEKGAATLARRWLRFVHYMQLDDGRMTNFIVDRRGRRNLSGATSYPGGAWWTARTLWAWAAAFRVLGSQRALDALLRCPIPAPETPGELKTRAVLALAGLELLRSRAPEAVRDRWRRYVRYWCDAMVYAAQERPFVPDHPDQESVQLWGYHQLHALAEAAVLLGDETYLAAAEQSVRGLAAPVLAGNFYYAYPGERAHQCAYCVTPLVQGLTALFRATGQQRYRTLAMKALEWFEGANDAGTVMYDPATGRCLDGLCADDLSGAVASRNCGAESAIEAGFAELARRQLAATKARVADVVGSLTGLVSEPASDLAAIGASERDAETVQARVWLVSR